VAQNPPWRALLAWPPLMKGGQTPEFVTHWRSLAEQEPDDILRKTLGSLALIFSELTDSRRVWEKGLEGFNVRESIFGRELRTEGRVETYQENLVRVLRSRFPGAQLDDVEQRVKQQKKADELSRWFDLALSVGSPDDFRSGIRE
jgi:hypothetical protein